MGATAWIREYGDVGNTYGGVCLNCGSGRCGYFGGCRDRDDDKEEIKEDVSQIKETQQNTSVTTTGE